MNISRNICILCSIETNFYISLLDNYCRKSELLKKIDICLSMSIKEGDFNVICHNCVCNVEKFYDFVVEIRKAQAIKEAKKSGFKDAHENTDVTRLNNDKYVVNHSLSYVHEQMYNSNFSFSIHENIFEDHQQVRTKNTSPVLPHKFERLGEQKNPCLWSVKTQPVNYGAHFARAKECKKRSLSNISHQKSNTHMAETVLTSSRDIFESPSNTQDVEAEPRSFDWKLTPDENIMKRIREKCFGRSDF